MSEVVDGDSVFVVRINGKEFTHRSTSGAVELFENREKTALRVRVTSGRGTFIASEIDHYYFADEKGDVSYLGNLKASWYRDEQMLGFEVNGFHSIPLRPTVEK